MGYLLSQQLVGAGEAGPRCGGHPGLEGAGAGYRAFQQERPQRCAVGGHRRPPLPGTSSPPQPQKRPRTSWQRFEAVLPNETWQADMTHWSIDDGTEEGMKVEIFDFVDDYSRMVVAAVVVPVATAADVVAAFYKGASTWGFPASMLTDNGCIFTAQFHRPHSARGMVFAPPGL